MVFTIRRDTTSSLDTVAKLRCTMSVFRKRRPVSIVSTGGLRGYNYTNLKDEDQLTRITLIIVYVSLTQNNAQSQHLWYVMYVGGQKLVLFVKACSMYALTPAAAPIYSGSKVARKYV